MIDKKQIIPSILIILFCLSILGCVFCVGYFVGMAQNDVIMTFDVSDKVKELYENTLKSSERMQIRQYEQLNKTGGG